MPALLLVLLAAAPLQAAPASQPADNPKCSPHPVLPRLPGEYLSSCEHLRLGKLELRRWRQPGSPRAGTEKVTVEGESWYLHDGLARDAAGREAGSLEARRHVERAVREAGGTILYVPEAGGLVHFHLPSPGGDYWGISGCANPDGSACPAITHWLIRAGESGAPLPGAPAQVGTAPPGLERPGLADGQRGAPPGAGGLEGRPSPVEAARIPGTPIQLPVVEALPAACAAGQAAVLVQRPAPVPFPPRGPAREAWLRGTPPPTPAGGKVAVCVEDLVARCIQGSVVDRELVSNMFLQGRSCAAEGGVVHRSESAPGSSSSVEVCELTYSTCTRYEFEPSGKTRWHFLVE